LNAKGTSTIYLRVDTDANAAHASVVEGAGELGRNVLKRLAH
jgi:hypothetical protein